MIRRSGYLDAIRPFMNKKIIKVLTGMRRSGKTTLLQLLQNDLKTAGVPESQIFSANFESMAYENTTASEMYGEITRFIETAGGKSYIFLDEVQELDGWERVATSLLADTDCDIYITGSNAKLLSGELATLLAGRYVELKVYPFSFKEAWECGEKGAGVERAFRRYVQLGGMPFIYANSLDSGAAAAYLRDIYNSIVLKDIAARYSVRDLDLLQRIMHYLVSNVANTFSGPSLSKFLRSEKRSLAQETLYNYISYAKEACLLHLAPREDVLGKKGLKFQEKIFLADHGIREALTGRNERDINQVLENIVYVELLRRGYSVSIGRAGDREIDFAAVKGRDKLYIQVAYLLADDSVVEREFSSLLSVRDNFPKYVLSMDSIDRSREGIIHRNIAEFLLEDEV